MTLIIRGNIVGGTPGLDALRQQMEMRMLLAGLNDGDSIGNPITGHSKFQGTVAANLPMFAFLAGSNVVGLKTLDGHRCADWNFGGASAGQNICWVFRPSQTGNPFYVDVGNLTFRTTDAAYLPVQDRRDIGLAFEMSAWMRKVNAGDTSDCRFCFGFANNRVTSPSRRMTRCGLVGDGAGGYRFGSVNCPDAFAGGAANNAAGDIDANSVQPDAIKPANIGTNWFKVRLKMVPATKATPARWAAYLNNVRVAIFDQQANFPRGHQGVSDGNSLIEASILNMQSDTVGLQIPVPGLDMVTVSLTDDYTL